MTNYNMGYVSSNWSVRPVYGSISDPSPLGAAAQASPTAPAATKKNLLILAAAAAALLFIMGAV